MWFQSECFRKKDIRKRIEMFQKWKVSYTPVSSVVSEIRYQTEGTYERAMKRSENEKCSRRECVYRVNVSERRYNGKGLKCSKTEKRHRHECRALFLREGIKQKEHSREHWNVQILKSVLDASMFSEGSVEGERTYGRGLKCSKTENCFRRECGFRVNVSERKTYERGLKCSRKQKCLTHQCRALFLR